MTSSKLPTSPRAARTAGATLDDTPLATPLYSPVCTFCKWWGAHPDRWQFCSAYPHTEGVKIPQPIWDGRNDHVTPYGGEARDKQGQPYLFEPVPGAKLPPALKAAYEAAREARENKTKPKGR